MKANASFLDRLIDRIIGDPLREKVLLCPSQRVGRQWLDRAALRAGGVVNVRPLTVRRLLLECAEPLLKSRGLRPAGREEKIRIVAGLLERMKRANPDGGYFTRLPTTMSLAGALLSALEELETARVRSGPRLADAMAARDKADEIAALARGYRAALARGKLAGAADICLAAAEGAAGRVNAPLLLLPASLAEDATLLEQRFFAAWPHSAMARLSEDGDGHGVSMSFRLADSVANEARLVLRTVWERGVPLDRVEAVCLDQETYVPVLCAAGLEMFGGRVEDLPFTFNGGIPAAYSRPARLLTAWLEWLELDLPPEGLARMIESGLMGRDWQTDAPGVAAERLAERVRELPVNGGLDEYRRVLGRDGPDYGMVRAERWLLGMVERMVPVAGTGEPTHPDDPARLLRAAGKTLRVGARADSKLDAYARTALAEAAALWIPHADWTGFNGASLLGDLASRLRVMGMGPRPGALHVADVFHGGHSGRPLTFILGMDDSRYPGAPRQDPVLLDGERLALSRHLPASARKRERREKAFSRLIARLDGEAAFSCSRRDSGGRDLFPAPLFGRLADDAGRPIGGAATLLPESGKQSLCERDDWLLALLAHRANRLTPRDLEKWFPHLAGGALAAAERASDRFTEWDGLVPEAGVDYLAEEWQVSPTDLEVFAACPLEFFFRRVLRLRPPERYEPAPGRWLEGNERGSLLHDLFQDFLGKTGGDEAITRENWDYHRDALLGMMEKALGKQRRRKPPRDPLAYERERAEMFEACVIFLAEEVLRQERGRPLCLEAALGGGETDRPPWSRCGPVAVPLASGGRLLLRGRVDRIDRLHGGGGLMILDYKTGRSDKFSRDDPFNRGRHLQPLLYAKMLERVLADAGLPEPVRGFSYFFPMPRDEGRTFTYDWERLNSGGMEIVEILAGMLASGRFPFTTERADAAYSDYLPLYGDVGRAVAAVRRKARRDPALADWAALREVGGE